MARHHLEPDERTLHGFFSRDLAPVLAIEPGDIVVARTLDAGWRLERPTGEDAEAPRAVSRHEGPMGHALCGPIAIRGARPGMALGIHLERIEPGEWGLTFARGPWAEEEATIHHWRIDGEAGRATNQHGHSVAVRPFMGVLGVAPPEAGPHSTIPPRRWGGNIDCKELVAGSTLYLPVGVEGALFSLGDGHAAQGDGEISGTAIECPMRRVELRFELVEAPPLPTPYARTPSGWLTFGVGEGLGDATAAAATAMLALMRGRYDLGPADALALASVAVDLRVTQIVNGTVGVHALLPHDAIGGLEARG